MNDQSSGDFDFEIDDNNEKQNINFQDHDQIELLKEKVRTLEEQKKSLETQFEDLLKTSNETESVYIANNELQKKIHLLQSENDDLKKRIDISATHDKEMKEENEKLKNEFKMYRATESNKYQQQFTDLKQNLDSKINSLTSENEILKRQNKQINEENSKMKEDIQNLLEVVQNKWQKPFPNLQSFIQFMRNNSLAVKRDSTIIETTQSQYGQIIPEKLAKKYKKLANYAKSLEASNEALETEKVQQKKQYEAAINEAKKEMKEFQRQQKIKDRQNDEEKEKLQMTISNLQSKFEQLKAEHAQMSQVANEMSAKLDNDEEKANQQEIIEVLTENLKKAEKDKDKYKKQCQELVPQFEELKRAHNKLEEKVESQKEKHHAAKVQLKAKLNEKETENNQNQTKIAELENKNAQLSELNKNLTQNNNQIKSSLASLQTQYSNLSKSFVSFESMMTEQSKNDNEFMQFKQQATNLIEKQSTCLLYYEKECSKLVSNYNKVKSDLDQEKCKNNSRKNDLLPEAAWQCYELPKELGNSILEIGRCTVQPAETRLKHCLSTVAQYIQDQVKNFEKQTTERTDKSNNLFELLKQLLLVVNDQIGSPRIEPEELLHDPSLTAEIASRLESKSFTCNATFERSFCAPDSLQQLLDALEVDDIEAAEQNALNMKQQILDQNSRMKSLVSKNKNLKGLLLNFKKKLDEAQKEFDALICQAEEKLESLQSQLDESNDENAALQSHIDNLNEQLNNLKNQHLEELEVNRSKQMNESKMECQRIENGYVKQLKQKDQKLQNMQQELEKAQKSLEKAKMRNDQLNQELEEKENEFEVIKEEVKQARRSADDKYEVEIKSLTDQHNKLMDELKKENKDKDEAIQKGKRMLKEAANRYSQLNDSKNQLAAEKRQLKHDYDAKAQELDREKKLADMKLKSLVQSTRMNAKNEIELVKMESEKQIRELYRYAAEVFTRYFDPQIQMTDSAYKNLLRKAKSQLDELIQQDESIRKALGVMGNENIEEIISQLLVKCGQKKTFNS